MHELRIRRASKREGLKMEKKNWLTLKTKAGCWHLFLILVRPSWFSAAARS